ncbi:SDR family NAD(P)-dependent oxidoreductase [Papillibacter cinnamivorans]|uniref:NAD(P)-dependent dehydrogenase, short-chain alcohol dehydrogenase family n=1 Tax=Papillibacter cinnamivorans DSM 12816 TaxID=1122930 RepID=A0A1W2CBV3_9FIRM|nr:SDR family NAD(P)-dependent oxidoreductase [Papillibacter cinnamivorans]SMC82566.1 NAD(P)-dependent dehydrogenase, short-chain alcohol dehydrogenase family [Papillibacter cinnamivorans DSM 12816]
MGKLDGKIAVVTGAGSGFGRAISLKFAQEGARVVCLDIQHEALTGGYDDTPEVYTDQLIRDRGGEAIFVKCDISKETDVIAAFGKAVDHFGTIDILVNNAGIFRGGAFYKIPMSDVDAVIAVNLRGTWMCCKEALKTFVPKKSGKIVNMVSTAGLRGTPGQTPYNATKGALADLTWCLAIEYGGVGVTVNGICPTYSKTSLTTYSYGNPEFRQRVTDMISLHRWGETKDVANAALFLASPDADFITGALLPVDGGETLAATMVKDYALLMPELEELI